MADPRAANRNILLGRIGAAHGIRGAVRITSFTADPLAIADYDPLDTDRPGLAVTITQARLNKGVVVAQIEGVSDRNQAETLNGVSLYVDRERLPAEDDADDFYQTDLIGLSVRLTDGTELGEVVGVDNFGADDLLDIRLAARRQTVYLPFTKAVIPTVALSEGYLVADPPVGWLDDDTSGPDA